jgi:hypothetical protein
VLSGLLGGLASYAITTQMNGLGGLRAWQWLFLLEGLPGIPLPSFCFASFSFPLFSLKKQQQKQS